MTARSARFYDLAGELEIMTHSAEHEHIKNVAGRLRWRYYLEEATSFDRLDAWTMPRCVAALKEASAEPDDSWCIGDEKEVP